MNTEEVASAGVLLIKSGEASPQQFDEVNSRE